MKSKLVVLLVVMLLVIGVATTVFVFVGLQKFHAVSPIFSLALCVISFKIGEIRKGC